jgi:hypothetical protein
MSTSYGPQSVQPLTPILRAPALVPREFKHGALSRALDVHGLRKLDGKSS